jgi:hypothetical protein
LRNRPTTVPKKIWERLSGVEPRRLWEELTNTQKELTNTQQELTNTQQELTNTQQELTNTQQELTNNGNWNSHRDGRMHPFILEALSLLPDSITEEKSSHEINGQYESPFTLFGSDKDTRHSYGPLYLEAIKDIESPRILEIGVGSVNDYPYAGFPSSALTPGGSLKAFRHLFPKALIVGIDIDPCSINTIKSNSFFGYIVDQTSDESLAQAKSQLINHGPFDLIIDDGFHDPHANIRTLKALFELLDQNGTYVIEDVHNSLIDFWKVVSMHLPGRMQVIDMSILRPGVDDNVLVIFKK